MPDQTSTAPAAAGQVPATTSTPTPPPVAAGTAATAGTPALQTPPVSAGQDAARQERDDATEPYDRDRAMSTISRLREFEKQAKAQAKELDELRKKQKDADDAKLSEQERLTKRVQELEAAMATAAEEKRAVVVRAAVEREARKLNLIDEDAAYRLLDLNALEYGDDGLPTNVEALLKLLAKAKPYLVRPEAAGTAPGVAGVAGVPGLVGGVPRTVISATPRADDGRAAQAADIERMRRVELARARASM